MDFTRAAEEIVKSSKFFLRHYSLNHIDAKIKLSVASLEEKGLKDFVYGLPDVYLYKVIPLSLVVLDKEEVIRFVEVLREVRNLVKEGLTVYYSSEFWVWLLSVISRLKNDYDYVLVVDGYEGSGKSMSAMSIAYFYRRIVMGHGLERSNVVFTPDEIAKTFSKWINQNIHCDVVVIDEGGAALFSRESMSSITKKFIKVFKIARMMNWFLILVAQNITWLDVYIRKHRITGWISKRSREEGLFVSGVDFKREEEWKQDHFNVIAFLKKVKTERFLFSDFVFDEEFLKDYRDHKQEFVRNSVEELKRLVEGNEDDIKLKLFNVLDRGLALSGIPYVVPFFDFFYASKLPINEKYVVDKSNPYFVTNDILKISEDPITSFLYKKEVDLKYKYAFLEARGLPQEIADFFELHPSYSRVRGVNKPMLTFFDIWKINIMGYAALCAQSEVLLRNYNPLAYKLAWYYHLLHALGSECLIKTQLVMFTRLSYKTRHQASVYLFNLPMGTFNFETLFNLIAPDIKYTDVKKWLYHNILEHLQLYFILFSSIAKQISNLPDKREKSKMSLPSEFRAVMQSGFGSSQTYLFFLRRLSTIPEVSEVFGMPISYNQYDEGKFLDFLNNYFYTKVGNLYGDILEIAKTPELTDAKKIVSALSIVREMNAMIDCMTLPISEIKNKQKELMNLFEKYFPQFSDSMAFDTVLEVLAEKGNELKEFSKFLYDFYTHQINAYLKMIEESKEIIERATGESIESLEEETGTKTEASKEEIQKEFQALEEFLVKFKELPDYFDIMSQETESEEREVENDTNSQ